MALETIQNKRGTTAARPDLLDGEFYINKEKNSLEIKKDSTLLELPSTVVESFNEEIILSGNKFAQTIQTGDINISLASSGHANNSIFRLVIDGNGTDEITISDDFFVIGVTDNSQYNIIEFFYSISSIKPICAITLVPKFTQLATPGNFTATPFNTSIALDWDAVTNATIYTVERSPDGLTGWAPVYTGINTFFTNTGLTISTEYFYRVKASGYGYTSSNYAETDTETTNVAETAYQLTGQDQSVSFASEGAIGFPVATAQTILFKFKLTATGGLLRIVRGNGSNFIPAAINVLEAAGNIKVDVAFATSLGNFINTFTAASYSLNTWYSVAVTWDGTTGANSIKIYINNVEDATNGHTGTFTGIASGGNFSLGTVNFSGTDYHSNDAEIDELTFIDKVLNGTERTEAYNSGAIWDMTGATFFGNMVAYFRFNNTLLDETGNGHDGTAITPNYV